MKRMLLFCMTGIMIASCTDKSLEQPESFTPVKIYTQKFSPLFDFLKLSIGGQVYDTLRYSHSIPICGDEEIKTVLLRANTNHSVRITDQSGTVVKEFDLTVPLQNSCFVYRVN